MNAGEGITPLAADELTELGSLCRTHFGAGCRIVASSVTRRQRDYLVVVATLSGLAQPVAIKLAGPDTPLACPFERTAAILRLVRAQTAVPVPEPLAQDVSYRDYPWRYAIMTALPGVSWQAVRQGWTLAARRDAWVELGRAVAALHTITFPACGEIGKAGEVIEGQRYDAALTARAGRRIADRQYRDIFLRVLNDRAALFRDSPSPCLSHEDLNPTNILVAPDARTGRWRLTGILDFDSAWAGGRESDLARLALWEGMTGDDFWTAYGLDRALTPAETERRTVLQLLWCLEYAQPTPRHHADTGRVCAALGLSPITFG